MRYPQCYVCGKTAYWRLEIRYYGSKLKVCPECIKEAFRWWFEKGHALSPDLGFGKKQKEVR